MEPNTEYPLTGPGGLRGVAIPGQLESAGQPIRVRLDSGEEYAVPAELLTRQPDGQYQLLASLEALAPYRFSETPQPSRAEAQVIPLAEERVKVGKKKVNVGGVKVRKTVKTRTETVDMPLLKETVKVERVKVDRVLDAPAQVRQEGEVTIIPVMEETVVVQKRLVLREEIRITRQRTETHQPRPVTLRAEEAEIEDLPAPPAEEAR